MVVDELFAGFVLIGFVAVMLLLPFGIMIGMALPGRNTRRTAVSENRQSMSASGDTMEA